MESQDVVKFGIFDDFSHVFGTGIITNVIPLNHREMIISTTKEIIKIERNIIKMRHPIKFCACAIVPDTDFLIGVTTKISDLVIYQIGDLPQTMQSYNSRSVDLPPPLLENYPINQSGIFHMIYSPKSQSIIIIGAGIKVFNLKYKLSRISVVKPTVSITHRSSFASNYATTILVPPAFDTDSELLLLPTDEGICAFSLDGEKIMQCSKFPASLSTVYATHPSKPPKLSELTTTTDDKSKKPLRMTKKLLTYDSDKGLVLWGKRGQLIDQFNTIGSSVLAIMFVDSENALCLNSSHTLFFLNIKTGKTFFSLNLEKNPSRIFLIFVNKQPILCACFSSYMRAVKIIIPWKVWNLNIDKAFFMCRCNKYRSAARVLINAENAFIKFYSPRNRSKMTVATPAEAVHSVSFLYDRGIYENYIFDEKNLRYMTKVMKITSKEEEDEKKKDENIEEEEKNDVVNSNGRDILFIILENGTILGFDTNVANCEEVMKMKCKAAFMSICRIRNFKKRHHHHKTENGENDNDDEKITYQWCYAVASEKSDLFILDYFSMKEVRHFTVSDDKLIKMFYHFDSECIIMVFERKTIMFDIEKGKIISTVLVGGNQITTMFANFLFFGYESGHLRRVSIENKQFVVVNNNKRKKKEEENENDNENEQETENNKSNLALQKPHDGPITGFSFSQKIWISSGLDGNVIVWDYNFEKVLKIMLPLPLKACLVMNGKRDILVATNTEVMQIKDSYLLDYFEDDPYDVEINEIDNFDKIKDALCHDSVEAFDPDAYDNLDMSNVLSDEYEEEKEDEKAKSKKKVDLPKISNNSPRKTTTTTTSSTPAKTTQPSTSSTSNNDASKENKPSKKPAEDSKEDIQKKLEMMQAMNGLGSSNIGSHPPPPSSSSSTSHPAASSSSNQPSSKPAEKKTPEKKKEEPKENKKETETKKKKPPKEGKDLSDFINSNMENEKAQNKRKKVKKSNNQEKEPAKDEGPKKSEEEVANMIGNLFDRNKPKNQGSSNKKKASGEGIDFNELAKKFQKDEDPVVVNLDKADLSKKGKNNNENDDGDDEADDESDSESSQKKKPSSNQAAKPKQNATTTKSNAKPTTNSNPKEKEKANTTTKPSATSKSNTKPKEKENQKENTKSNVVPTEKENKTSNNTNNNNKAKEKKPTKSSSSTKKEAPKTNTKPQESKTNENKVSNSSPKKTKQPSPPKSSSNTKPVSNSNTNNYTSNPASTTANNNPVKAASSNLNPTTSSNNNNNNNKVGSTNPSSNSVSNSNPAASKTGNDNPSKSDNSVSNSPQTQGGISNPYGNAGKVSIGTQGENFDDNNDAAEPEKGDDSLNIEVKMNGPRPPSNEPKTAETVASNGNENNNDNDAFDEADQKADENGGLFDAQDENGDDQNRSNDNENNGCESNEPLKTGAESSDQKQPQKADTSSAKPSQNTNQNEGQISSEKVNDNDHLSDHSNGHLTGSESDTQKPQRAPTPPPIRPQITSPEPQEIEKRVSQRKRPRTPPPRREKPPSEFRMPPPNVVIDQEAVLVLYGRGRLEFKPLVDRIQKDLMIAEQAGFYRQNKRITLAYVQNYGEKLKNEEEAKEMKEGGGGENEKKFSKTAQPIVPPITSPHQPSIRSLGHYYDPETPEFTGEKSVFNGSTNRVSPAFKSGNRRFGGLSNTLNPQEGEKSGVSFFNVSVENPDGKVNQIRHNRLLTPDMQRAFSPAFYVYNYENNMETIVNDIDTSSAVTTPRRLPESEVTGDDRNEKSDDEIDLENETIISDSKSYQKSPRRIQSARAVGRPIFTPSAKEPQVRMPFPLSPVVMASPRRSFNNNNNGSGSGRRPLFVSTTSPHQKDEEEIEIPADQLESAVMTKMPKLHLTSSTSISSPHLTNPQMPSPNVQPNFGQSQSFAPRPNSVRTFDRSPLMYNSPIGAGMLKPGSLKKRNASFYASVAVTTSISNARKSSPGYRTGSVRSNRNVGQNNRKSGNDQFDGYGGLNKTPPSEIEITVK